MDKNAIQSLFQKVRTEQPLVHHITNPVTMNDCANATLAIGASPVMAMSVDEVAEMVSLANALVVNFGTIDAITHEAMVIAGKAANEKGIPVILDPVGVGATTFRNEKAESFLKQVKVSIVRGNTTEVYALIGGNTATRGVDAGELKDMSQSALAYEAARTLQAVVVISGEQDVICDGTQQAFVENGDIWLTRITGTGCMTASLIGSFAGVTDNLFHAAIAGMSTMSLAGELAKRSMKETDGIGTYRMQLFDEFFKMDGNLWLKEVKCFEEKTIH